MRLLVVNKQERIFQQKREIGETQFQSTASNNFRIAQLFH
jgi:hypothetical protein